jgi:16S rRNA (uracil1498-N3)-methyltransferase
MNLLIINADELDDRGTVTLAGRRARHVLEVLRGKRGQTVRVGVLNGPKGTGTIEEAGKTQVTIRCHFDLDAPPIPRIDVLLALPRPKVMKRLWAPLASMGISRLYLTNAEKVERNYFDTHWLEPAHREPLLIEGLEQAGDTRLPAVRVIRRLKPFLEDELDSECAGSRRWIAHPGEETDWGRFRVEIAERVMLALGPEGGWTEFELKMFDRAGFSRISLGTRTLRTDTACIALLAIMNSAVIE